MSMIEKIENYGIMLDSLNLSPFELLNALSLRTTIEQEMNYLSRHEKLILYKSDLYLLDNVQDIKNHLENIYDFSSSDEPIEQWWWHLDKVISGEIAINLSVKKNVAL